MSVSNMIYTIWKEIKSYIWNQLPHFCLIKQFNVKLKNKKCIFSKTKEW